MRLLRRAILPGDAPIENATGCRELKSLVRGDAPWLDGRMDPETENDRLVLICARQNVPRLVVLSAIVRMLIGMRDWENFA